MKRLHTGLGEHLNMSADIHLQHLVKASNDNEEP